MSKIKLCDIYSCTQCHACEQACPKQCISFYEGKDGFSIPHIKTDECIECGLCVKSCHQLNLTRKKCPPLQTFAAWSKYYQVRTTSSSGGVFSEIARIVFGHNGVVFGAVMDENLKVHHTYATDMDSLFPMRGSKYVQSDMSGVYSQVKGFLKSGRLVLFTGTPCQVAGLYAFLKVDYDNLLTCDMVCHGVPSQKSFDIYCDKIGLNDKGVAEVSFRYTRGWGMQMSSRNYSSSLFKGRGYKWKLVSPRNSYYLRAFTNGLMFDETCYECHYATLNRVGDLTMADYWGIGKMAPFNYPTKEGVSLLLVNTEKGSIALKDCKHLFLDERPLNEAVNGNHNLSCRSVRPQGRDTFCSDAETMSVVKLSKKYGLLPSFRDYMRPIKRKLELL